MRNNPKSAYTDAYFYYIIISKASYMFQPKHEGGYTDYNTIYLHNCICICWLFHM